MPTEPNPKSFGRVNVVLPPDAGAVLKRIAGIFQRQVESRCNGRVFLRGEAPFSVELVVEKGIGTEGFRIADGKDGAVRIAGNDERGVLYGVGRFLRESGYDRGGFTPGAWRWRNLFIRAMLDCQLKLQNGGAPDDLSGFEELQRIYFTTAPSDPGVRPPIAVMNVCAQQR